jgi:FlaA1/EpsC-like NDP-sugar epimerase
LFLTIIGSAVAETDRMPRHNPNLRRCIAITHDLAAVIAAWCLAYLFRFNFDIPPSHLASLKVTLPWVIPIQAAVFQLFGLYRGVWRYASLPDLRRILLAILVGAAAVPLGLFLLQLLAGVPRSVLLLDPILLLLIMGGSRLTYRLWKEGHLFRLKDQQGNPVLVLGAGDTAVGLVKELARSKEWRVVGLLDDDPRRHRLVLHGFEVLGPIDQLPAIAEKLRSPMPSSPCRLPPTVTAAGRWRYALPQQLKH